MTGIYQDYQLQEIRKTRIVLERIAKSLESIDKSLYLSALNSAAMVKEEKEQSFTFTPNNKVFAINEPVDILKEDKNND